MDNKIEHFFVLKPDGKIYHIPDYPESFYYANDPVGWKRAVQSAIDNAVEVSNQKEVKESIYSADPSRNTGVDTYFTRPGEIFSLQCSVEECWRFRTYTTDQAYNSGRFYFEELFTDHAKMKVFSAKHSAEAKMNFPGYVSMYDKLALVIFSQPEKLDSVQWQDIMTTAAGIEPEREETQEELIRTIIDMNLNRGFRAYELAQHFTITRREKKTP